MGEQPPQLRGVPGGITKENASEMGKRGAAVRRQKRDEREQQKKMLRALAEAKLIDIGNTEGLGDLARGIVMMAGQQVLNGDVKITSNNVKAVAECFFNIAQLEQGKATTISASKEDRQALLAELQQKAKDRLQSVPPSG